MCWNTPTAGSKAAGWAVAGEFNKGTIKEFPFTYVYLEGEGHKILVDTGYDKNPHTEQLLRDFGCLEFQPPDKILGKLGVRPEQIDTVIVTHAHYDHMGNLAAFPNAQFYIQKREIVEWLNWFAKPKKFHWFTFPIDKKDLSTAVDLVLAGRMHFVEGDVVDFLPGIDLIPAYDTHTFGEQNVAVASESKGGLQRWVLITDLAFGYTNLNGLGDDELIRPVGFGVGGPANIIVSIDEAVSKASSVKHVLISHTYETFEVYPSKIYGDGLRVAEVNVASGSKSRL